MAITDFRADPEDNGVLPLLGYPSTKLPITTVTSPTTASGRGINRDADGSCMKRDAGEHGDSSVPPPAVKEPFQNHNQCHADILKR